MTEDAARRRFLGSMEAIMGQPFPDDPEARAELERAMAGTLGEGITWTELERRWDELALMANLVPDPDDVGLEVEDVFQATVDRIGERAFEPETLRRQSPAMRMLIATRAIEGQVDNGGWVAVFYNGVNGLLPLAIEGYELLGLTEHATSAARVLQHGFRDGADDDAEWRAFDDEWFALPSAERARAVFIRDHRSEFPGD